MAGAAGEFFAGGDLAGGTLAAIYLATFIGGVTFGTHTATTSSKSLVELKLLTVPFSISCPRKSKPVPLWRLENWLV